MDAAISEMVGQYEAGRITRRQLVSRLSAFALASVGLGGTAVAAKKESTFSALGLNHIALRVTDVSRSRDFYLKHLGLKVRREDAGRNCFMTCGDHFVALFRSDKPRMDHFCFSIKNYDQQVAAKKLEAHGIEPDTPRGTNRIYFVPIIEQPRSLQNQHRRLNFSQSHGGKSGSMELAHAHLSNDIGLIPGHTSRVQFDLHFAAAQLAQ